MASLRESLNYIPVELAFGTSGLRGLVTDMTDLECYINTSGFVTFLENDQQFQAGATIYLAGDLRDSTPRILSAVATAIKDKGYVVSYGGLLPTPAVANFALLNDSVCVMVTGSHIPADRNGIKFYKVGGEILKDDEAAIKSAVESERNRINNLPSDESKFGPDGQLKQADTLSDSNQAIEQSYVSRYADFFSAKPLAGKKVVVYQHSAVGRDLLVNLLEIMGASTATVGRSDVFIPIDTENVTPNDQAYFKKIAAENSDTFAIVSTDGDSDRPFVIDEQGVFHRGDELGAIVAEWLDADFAAVPISANDAVDQFLNEQKIELVHTRIGSPYVIVAMQEAIKSGKQKTVGWEVNGGFLLGSDLVIGDKKLSRLPTRDAFFPIFVALIQAAQQGISVSESFRVLPERFTQAGLIDNFPIEISRQIMGKITDDSTENRQFLREFFKDEQGFGEVTHINVLDGIRIFFENGDIAHLRPSGNAPQLRVYSVAQTQERADEIVELSITPGGIVGRIGSTAEVFSSQ